MSHQSQCCSAVPKNLYQPEICHDTKQRGWLSIHDSSRDMVSNIHHHWHRYYHQHKMKISFHFTHNQQKDGSEGERKRRLATEKTGSVLITSRWRGWWGIVCEPLKRMGEEEVMCHLNWCRERENVVNNRQALFGWNHQQTNTFSLVIE